MPSLSCSALIDNKTRIASAAALSALLVAGPLALSAQATVQVPPMKTAGNFSVLAGSAVTNIGVSTVAQDVGVSPGTSLPPAAGANALNVLGTRHSADAEAAQAQLDLTGAYDNARGQTVPTAQDAELGGETKLGGIYNVDTNTDMGLNGRLTLDGGGKTGSVWVFQAGRALTVGSGASVVLINGANPCNVYWEVDSTATLGTTSRMVGTIMAHTSVVMQTGATLAGRILASTAEVTMDHNVITNPACVPTPITGGTGGTGGTGTGGTGGTTTGTNGGTGSGGGTTTGTHGGTGNGGGATTTGTNGGTGGGTDTTQVTTTPTGSVDTGYAGPVARSDSAASGLVLAAGFGGLALFAVRRRRSM